MASPGAPHEENIMKKVSGKRSVFTTVVAGAAVLTLFGTGTAVAGGLITSAKIKNNTIRSIDVRDNDLQGVDVRDSGLTGADVADGSLGGSDVADGSVSGADLADGSVTGADIADDSLSNQDVGVLFAQVNANGTIANSSGGVTGIHVGTGAYEVDFHRNISSCAFVATQGEALVGGASGGILGVTDRAGNANAVFASVHDDAGASADRAFQLLVVC